MKEFEQFEKNYKTFTGFLSADPEIKYYEKGSCKCKFSIPLKKDEEIVWLNCESWNIIAENISEKYTKGSEITVVGFFKESEFNGKKYINFVVKMAM